MTAPELNEPTHKLINYKPSTYLTIIVTGI